MRIETQSLRPLRPNRKEFKWLRVFRPQCRVSIHMNFASHNLDHQFLNVTSFVYFSLYSRSEHFRNELFFSNSNHLLMRFVKLTIQGSTKLPKRGKAKKLRPQFVAVKLKAKALDLIQNWIQKYGDFDECPLPHSLSYITQKIGVSS